VLLDGAILTLVGESVEGLEGEIDAVEQLARHQRRYLNELAHEAQRDIDGQVVLAAEVMIECLETIARVQHLAR
jgi:hypothetical protein